MTKNQSQLIETIKSWRNPYRTHYNDGFNYALTKVIELLESPSEPEAQPEIVGWMVGEPGTSPAMYNLSERDKAFDAARRWERPITALVLDPRAPGFATPSRDRAPMRTALEFIRDGLIPQGMSVKLFAERVLAQCSPSINEETRQMLRNGMSTPAEAAQVDMPVAPEKSTAHHCPSCQCPELESAGFK